MSLEHSHHIGGRYFVCTNCFKTSSEREKLIDEWEKEPDHFTLPEDPDTKAGWGIFNFNWLMKPFKEAVEWHDKVTTKGSEAQKLGIPNWRINRAWREMLIEMSKGYRGNGFIRRLSWGAGFFVAKLNRYFYEGSLGKEPKVMQDKDSGDMF